MRLFVSCNSTLIFNNSFIIWRVLLLKEHLALQRNHFLGGDFDFWFLQVAHCVLHFTRIFQSWRLIRSIFCFVFPFCSFIYSVKSSRVTTFPPLFIDSRYPLMETYSDGMKEEIQLRMNSRQCNNHKAISWDQKKKCICISFLASLDLQGTKWVSIGKWLRVSGLFCNFWTLLA